MTTFLFLLQKGVHSLCRFTFTASTKLERISMNSTYQSIFAGIFSLFGLRSELKKSSGFLFKVEILVVLIFKGDRYFSGRQHENCVDVVVCKHCHCTS